MYKRQDEASAPLLLVAGQCCFLRLTERVETDTLRLSFASFVLPLFDTLRLVGVADEASAPLLLVVGQCCFLSLTPERVEIIFPFLEFFERVRINLGLKLLFDRAFYDCQLILHRMGHKRRHRGLCPQIFKVCLRHPLNDSRTSYFYTKT